MRFSRTVGLAIVFVLSAASTAGSTKLVAQVTSPEDHFGFRPGADFHLLTYEEAIRYFDSVTAHLTGVSRKTDGEPVDLGKLRALEGVREFPARVKCATLAWHALRSALTRDETPATTE